MKKIFLKTTSYTTLLVLIFSVLFYSFEPVYLIAQSDDDAIVVTLTVDSGITITSPADVTMSPNIGVASDSSIGNAVWNVKTNDPDGYTLDLKAGSSPALEATGDSFADYQTTAPDTWDVSPGDKNFGFSVFGDDVNTGTWGTGSSCGAAGVPSATLNYLGFATTSEIVAVNGDVTTTSGVDTTVCFAAEQNGIYAAAEVYTADITATATVQ